MSEKIALACCDCHHSFIVVTPDSQIALLELIDKYKLCLECGSKKMVQVAWKVS